VDSPDDVAKFKDFTLEGGATSAPAEQTTPQKEQAAPV